VLGSRGLDETGAAILAVLWARPGFVLVLSLLGIALWIRRGAPASPSPLSAEEKQRLSKLTEK
jgi:cytochrome c-type biogenesis protein CcmH/NrfF